MSSKNNIGSKNDIKTGGIFVLLCFVLPVIYYLNIGNSFVMSFFQFIYLTLLAACLLGIGNILSFYENLSEKVESNKKTRQHNHAILLMDYMRLAVCFYGGFDITDEKHVDIINEELRRFIGDILEKPEEPENKQKAYDFVENNHIVVCNIIESINKKIKSTKKEDNEKLETQDK